MEYSSVNQTIIYVCAFIENISACWKKQQRWKKNGANSIDMNHRNDRFTLDINYKWLFYDNWIVIFVNNSKNKRTVNIFLILFLLTVLLIFSNFDIFRCCLLNELNLCIQFFHVCFIMVFLYIAIRHHLEICLWVLSDFFLFFYFLSFFWCNFFWFLLLVWMKNPLRDYVFFLGNNYGLRWKYLEYYLNVRHAVMMLMWMPWLVLLVQMHSSVCRQNYAVHWTCYLMLQSIGPSPVQWYQDQHMVAQCISNESINGKCSKNSKDEDEKKNRQLWNNPKWKSIRIGDCFTKNLEWNIHNVIME